ncbi:MAG: efflux RND transporter periplasmic adaptor subunit [Nitrospiraceae bacterium]|nr:MAG: efflux RND transporter periplasmic adaptor subunit [Nitrospiraceae bacterium]
MMKKKLYAVMLFFLLFLSPPNLFAQEKQQAMPPAIVVVSELGAGLISPENEFIGTVYYREVSEVASEVSGLAEKAGFEEGQRVKKGDVLVVISSDLLEKTIQATRANHEQVLSDLQKERKNLERAETLFREQLLSEQAYDERRFTVSGLEKKAASLKAEVERLEVELSKKAVRSPFDGIVIKKHIETGEWLSPGTAVAAVGKDDFADVIAEVPESVIAYVRKGMDAKVKTGGSEMTGKVFSIVPKGDVSSRTIPVKVRIRNTAGLVEGMEARLILPAGRKEKALIAPRDAVITVFGNTVVFVVEDSKAKMMPVKVVGYKGMSAGILGDGLNEGMKVVVKGNERIRDGQAVVIQGSRE